MKSIVKKIEELEEITKKLKGEGKKIVTTSGAFDILHMAHINLLNRAKSFGDILIVFVNSDESIRLNKGEERPIIPETERAAIVASLKPVDYVVISPKGELLPFLARIKSDVHVKGGSVNPEKLKREIEFVKQWGCLHKVLELEEGYSTTKIIEKILSSSKPKSSP